MGGDCVLKGLSAEDGLGIRAGEGGRGQKVSVMATRSGCQGAHTYGDIMAYCMTDTFSKQKCCELA